MLLKLPVQQSHSENYRSKGVFQDLHRETCIRIFTATLFVLAILMIITIPTTIIKQKLRSNPTAHWQDNGEMSDGIFILWNTIPWQNEKKMVTCIKIYDSQKDCEKTNNRTGMQNDSTHPKFKKGQKLNIFEGSIHM